MNMNDLAAIVSESSYPDPATIMGIAHPCRTGTGMVVQ